MSDYDPKNDFDIEDYVKHLHRMKITPETRVNEAFDCLEMDGQGDPYLKLNERPNPPATLGRIE